MQRGLVEPRLRRRRHRDEAHDQDGVPGHAVVLVDRLGVVHASEHAGQVVLRDADEGLQEEEDVGDEAEDGVRGLEVQAVVVDLVILDDDEAGEEGEDGGEVEDGVDVGALLLLLGGVGRLQEEDGLRGEEYPGGIEELVSGEVSGGRGEWSRSLARETYRVRGEETERLDEDGGPNCCCELRLLAR